MNAIGIDPGKKTGLAVFNRREGRITEIKTLDFWKTIRWIETLVLPHDIYIEDPAQIGALYNRHRLAAQITGLRQNSLLKRIGTLTKIAQDVGRNKAHAALLIEFIQEQTKHYVHPLKPTGRKWTTAQMKTYTGFKRSNEHERDAARLCIGRI